MVFLTPALPPPRESPCRSYSWGGSIPCGHRWQSVPSFPEPHAFLFKRRKSHRKQSHRTEGVRGVCGAPERIPSPGLPEPLRCSLCGAHTRAQFWGSFNAAARGQRQPRLLRDAQTTKLFPSRAGGAGRFQPCEKRLVPPSAGNGAHLSKHISTCQRDLCRAQLKKALASAGSPGLPGEIKGTRGGF